MRAGNPLYSQEPMAKGPFRRPHSALAGRLPASGAAFTPSVAGSRGDHPDDSDEMLGDAAATKARHLSFSRRLIELWGLLEVPAQRRQESIGSSMVLIVPSAAHVAKLRKLVEELEDYAQHRQRDSKLLLSTIAHQRQSEPYRPHVSDEIPLHERRPVSAAFVRPASASLQASRQRVWSRPGSAKRSRPLSAAAASAPAAELRGTDVPQRQPDNPSNDGAEKEAAKSVSNAAAVIAPLSASTYVATAADPSEGKCSPGDHELDTDGCMSSGASRKVTDLRKRVSETHNLTDAQERAAGQARDDRDQRPSSAAVGVGSRASDRVDASTMTVESYIQQDSAAIRSLLSLEEARRHDVEEMYARPMSKLYLLFLTRVADLEERVVRGLPSRSKGQGSNDAELLAAMSASGDAGTASGSSVASEYGPSLRQINKITTDETMARVFLVERAERIAEIEYAILINFFEESSRRTLLCEVMEPDGWRRTIGYILNDLSTVLCDGQWLVTSAYLARYDIEREECIAFDRLVDKIVKFLDVFRATDGAVREESRLRRGIENEELVTDAVLYAQIRDSFAPLFHARFRSERVQLVADEQCARSELEGALLDMLEGHFAQFAQAMVTARENVAEYAAAAAKAGKLRVASQDNVPPAAAAAAAVENSHTEQPPAAESAPSGSAVLDQSTSRAAVPPAEGAPVARDCDEVPPQPEPLAMHETVEDDNPAADASPKEIADGHNNPVSATVTNRQAHIAENDPPQPVEHLAEAAPGVVTHEDVSQPLAAASATIVTDQAALANVAEGVTLATEPLSRSPVADGPLDAPQPDLTNAKDDEREPTHGTSTPIAASVGDVPLVAAAVPAAVETAEQRDPTLDNGEQRNLENHAQDTAERRSSASGSGTAGVAMALDNPLRDDEKRSPPDQADEQNAGAAVETTPAHADELQGGDRASIRRPSNDAERDTAMAGHDLLALGSDAEVAAPGTAAHASASTDSP